MIDAIVVLNAGSSSLKFSVFAQRDGDFVPIARGQAEGLHTAPRFVARDSAGKLLNERSWGEGVELDAAANEGNEPRISTPASRVSAWVIPTNEELMIARHTRRLL